MINGTIDNIGSGDMSKIYCKCGNIVSLDKDMVKIKKHLKKRVECPWCRNFRISMEIDTINNIFDGILEDTGEVCFF